jgi:hypothetical protein
MKNIGKDIKVRSKDNKQFILKSDGTYEKVENFKVGDSFKFLKEWKTSEGDIQVDDVFIIDTIWGNDKKSKGIYWIRCVNRKHDGSRGRKDDDWVMGISLMDFNDNYGDIFIINP